MSLRPRLRTLAAALLAMTSASLAQCARGSCHDALWRKCIQCPDIAEARSTCAALEAAFVPDTSEDEWGQREFWSVEGSCEGGAYQYVGCDCSVWFFDERGKAVGLSVDVCDDYIYDTGERCDRPLSYGNTPCNYGY